MGTQKNNLNETVLLGTKNTCLNWWVRKLLQFYAKNVYFSGPMTTYSKTCVKRPPSKKHKLIFATNYRLMQVINIAECSKGSILQYFQPSLSYHLSLRSLFCLFLSGRFVQVLLNILKILVRIAHLEGPKQTVPEGSPGLHLYYLY